MGPSDLELINAATSAATEQPDDPDRWVRLGRLLFEPGHRSHEALDADPTSISARFWSAKVYFHHLFNMTVAERLLNQALELDPRRPECLSLFASVRMDLGAPAADVMAIVRRAVAEAPDWRTPREQLVNALIDAGRPGEAAAELASLETMPTIEPPNDPADAYFEGVVTGRSRKSHELWKEHVDRRLGVSRGRS